MALNLKDLKNIRQLRAALRTCSVAEIADIAGKINVIQKEREKEEEKLQEAMKARERSVNNALSFLEKEDIDVYDLIAALNQKSVKKRGKMMPKYAYTDLDGINRTWTGQGKTPLALLKLMQKTGASLDDFLIRKETQQSLD
ncbi:H-NS family histone-like protein [Succinatimonas hippei]|uniref:H-NS family histone-like protein n=1 Tax=Succinatimonas hippei TaxID=626938 RepID=UPI0023F7BD48|nr:H-NS family nucleoid-associated regulatory protein [Succinatimonas hippei]MDM8120842.1 H-NS family nucleoid-associated regulatory protein [Succinatimonas hippei]